MALYDLDQSEEMGDRTKKAIAKIYLTRLTILKTGFHHASANDYKVAVEKYLEYLNIIAAHYEIHIDEIRPSILHNEDPGEIFLISQVYWYMAKLFDKNPKVYGQFKKYLEKFVIFSTGQKFQFVNSELIRRYISKRRPYNSSDFVKAYKTLRPKGGNCFISTYCYGTDHLITQNLRTFKLVLKGYSIGRLMVGCYYFISPQILRFLFRFPKLGRPVNYLLLRPLVKLVYNFWDLKVLKKS